MIKGYDITHVKPTIHSYYENGEIYYINLVNNTCNCDNYDDILETCKHIEILKAEVY